MRTALLAAVSHDLRTPLASIKASISSLRQHDIAWSREDEDELHETIEESADRLHALVANLLDMSRVQAGAVQPCVRRTTLDEIVPAALHDVEPSVPVALDVPEHLPLVLTDAGLVERALANLVSNAARFNRSDEPISVSAREEGDEVVVDVVDHGPGVPAADRARIFEPFQRLGDTSPTTGVGLGLAVAKGFIEAVGGRLDALDTPGGGLTMRVRLVAAPPPAVPEPLLR
jgi:two-component system sensor histidine kinase KdpD